MNVAAKPRKTTFKHVEAEWYNYYHTLNEINRLREEITFPFREVDDENTGGGKSNLPGNPTERIATRLATNKKLEYLNEIAEAIEKVYNALPDDYKKLVRLKYWNRSNKLTWEMIANELHVSKRQAMRWRDDIVFATIEVLGWR
ncbi:transcriptional regulator [Caldifermentibacillus hisashii]|uniref:transcriptional regulator n=1 Tax=Caldifermentibacillus hisashii TaxID=996558 RepID=UPI00342EAFF5